MKPEFVRIGDIKYPINTDFRVALECDDIVRNDSVGEYEKVLAIIYKLFGDVGLDDKHNHEKLLELAIKYLSQMKTSESSTEEPSMDYEQDRGYIKASFLSDYKIMDIWSIDYMHFYDFMDYLNGLTEDSVLNRVRYVREYDISDIKNHKERDDWIKRKKAVELKKKTKTITEKQSKSVNRFMELAKLK